MDMKVSTQYLILADFGRGLFLPPPEQLLFPDNLYGLPPMSLAELETHIRSIPDFPKPGILFRDITPLLHDRFRDTIDEVAGLFTAEEWQAFDAIVGVESRGFILASGLAYALGKGLLVVRKPGKLPPPHHTVSYSLEYGQDSLQMSSNFAPQRVLVADDVLATGGTLRATCELCEQCGHDVVGITTLIDLAGLNDFSWKGLRTRSLFSYGD